MEEKYKIDTKSNAERGVKKAKIERGRTREGRGINSSGRGGRQGCCCFVVVREPGERSNGGGEK